MRIWQRILQAAPCLLLAIQAAPAAEPWPARPVTFIYPLASGGASDRELRRYTQKLQENTGQSFVLDFKPGGGTVIGIQFVARSKPDGHTWVLTTAGLSILPVLNDKLPFDPLKDLEPTSLLSRRATLLIARAGLPAQDYVQYIAWARANPGKINFATAGQGGATHLTGVWLHNATQTNVTFVHFKGAGAYLGELLGERVDVGITGLSTALPHLKSGRLKPIAIITTQKVAALPQVKTVAESGIPDFEYPSWLGLLGPAKTPPAIVAAMSAEARKAVMAPELAESMQAEAIIPVGSTPEQFARMLATEIARMRKLVQDNNIKVEE